MEPQLNAFPALAMPPGVHILEIHGLGRAYAGNWAVDNVSLGLERGEFLSLLGPSGSGKSTILKMIAGFEPADAGRLLLDGVDITAKPPQKRDIGMVFQNYALFPHMTAEENIAFPLRMRRRSRLEMLAAVNRMLELLQLGELRGRFPAQLSGGQQQRVALARALVFEPRLLLMDEPLAALDRQLRRQVQLEIKRIHQRLGVSVIFVTHDQEEAMFLSERIAVMRGGRIVQQGSPASLYTAPQNRFVAGFIGNANFLPAVVEAVSAGVARVRFAGGAGTGVAVGRLEPGQSVECLVRPEAIQLASTDALLHGTVELVNFLGDQVELSLSTPAGSMSARLALRGAVGLPAAGSSVGIGWSAEDVRVFAAGEPP